MITVKSNRAVSQFRRVLRSKLRNGTAKLRVFGSKGAWTLGVQVGETIHCYSQPYITMATAVMAGYRKFGIKASQYKVKLAA